MRVHFKGGPFGGETREMLREDFVGRRLKVPVHYRLNAFEAVSPDPLDPANQLYNIEEYELERTLGPTEFEARWVPTHLGIQKRIRELTADLNAAEFEIEELREKLAAYEKIEDMVEAIRAVVR